MTTQTTTRRFLYKACSRCHGDLLLDREVEPSLLVKGQIGYVCLQCGRGISIESLRQDTPSNGRSMAYSRAA
jgi:hypothetical protein